MPFAVAESPMKIIKATGPFDVKMAPASAADGAHYYTFEYSLPEKS